jgi:hypothetical protein
LVRRVTLSASRLVDVPEAQLEVLFAGDGEPVLCTTPVKPGAPVGDDRVRVAVAVDLLEEPPFRQRLMHRPSHSTHSGGVAGQAIADPRTATTAVSVPGPYTCTSLRGAHLTSADGSALATDWTFLCVPRAPAGAPRCAS